MTLLGPRGYLGNCTLIHLTDPIRRPLLLFRRRAFLSRVVQSALLQTRIVEPDVVIPSIVSKLLLVLDSPLAEDRGLQGGASAVLLLEFCVCRVKRGRF